MLSQGGTDAVDTALRVFLMLCLLASLAVCGFKATHVPETRPQESFEMSAGTIALHPSLPKVSLGFSIR